MQFATAQVSRGHALPRTSSQRAVKCRMSGPGPNFGNDPSRQAPRLILPGQSGGGSPPRTAGGSGLVLPGKQSGAGGGGSSLPSDGPTLRNFRPPPGFMDADGGNQVESDMPAQDMLNRLQAQAGHWHELAKLLPALQSKGFDAFAVEEATGLERKTQNLWFSTASIYDALKKSGLIDPKVMAYYDIDGTEELLHELRFLSLSQRCAAVAYIAQKGLDQVGCTVLARAMKEHERRKGAREGFSESPGDCLAFKHYRDALECRQQEAADACVKKGLSLVESEGGRAKLEAISSGGTGSITGGPPRSEATLPVLRLEKDEVGCRPIALAGSLALATADKVRSAPKVSSEGFFGAFTIPVSGQSWPWAPLPAWSIVSLAGRPVAFDVPNCADLPSLRATARIKSDDDLRKLTGPGLLVVDVEPAVKAAVTPAQYYMVAKDNGGVEILEGSVVSDEALVVGPVMFLCRPPQRDAAGASVTELIQV